MFSVSPCMHREPPRLLMSQSWSILVSSSFVEKQKEKLEREAANANKSKQPEVDTQPVGEVATPVVKPKVTLRNYPSIIIQQRSGQAQDLQAVSLDVSSHFTLAFNFSRTPFIWPFHLIMSDKLLQTILDTKPGVMDSRSYELILCAHMLLDMVRRDAIFTLFRALVTAGDRGVQAIACHHGYVHSAFCLLWPWVEWTSSPRNSVFNTNELLSDRSLVGLLLLLYSTRMLLCCCSSLEASPVATLTTTCAVHNVAIPIAP